MKILSGKSPKRKLTEKELNLYSNSKKYFNSSNHQTNIFRKNKKSNTDFVNKINIKKDIKLSCTNFKNKDLNIYNPTDVDIIYFPQSPQMRIEKNCKSNKFNQSLWLGFCNLVFFCDNFKEYFDYKRNFSFSSVWIINIIRNSLFFK